MHDGHHDNPRVRGANLIRHENRREVVLGKVEDTHEVSNCGEVIIMNCSCDNYSRLLGLTGCMRETGVFTFSERTGCSEGSTRGLC